MKKDLKNKSKIKLDLAVAKTAEAFDYDISDGIVEFEAPSFELPSDFGIGLIVGGSGSGKSTILNSIKKPTKLNWSQEGAVVSHFNDYEDAKDKLSAAGLNSIPNWVKPYRHLSNGEQFRADLARRIEDGAVIDEFTSVVDRNVAKSCSVALSKYVERKGLKNIILASCHFDIIDWLQPDWVFDVDIGEFRSKKQLDQASVSSLFLAQPKLGHFSASITISTETSIKVHDAG